jgi:hypothetical protein
MAGAEGCRRLLKVVLFEILTLHLNPYAYGTFLLAVSCRASVNRPFKMQGLETVSVVDLHNSANISELEARIIIQCIELILSLSIEHELIL